MKMVLIYWTQRDGKLSWLHNEISVWHRELNPDTAAHLSTKRAGRRLTSLIEANALPQCQTTSLMGHLGEQSFQVFTKEQNKS